MKDASAGQFASVNAIDGRGEEEDGTNRMDEYSSLPSIAFTDANWPAGASFIYSRQFSSAIKIHLCVFLCGNLLVEVNLCHA